MRGASSPSASGKSGLSRMPDALIIGEITGGEASSSTLEGVAAARALGAERVSALLAGPGAAAAAQSAIAGGADAVYTVSDGPAADGEFDAIVAAAHAAALKAAPAYVIGAKTLTGRDVMPRLAFRLGTALAADCTALALDEAGRPARDAAHLRRQRRGDGRLSRRARCRVAAPKEHRRASSRRIAHGGASRN